MLEGRKEINFILRDLPVHIVHYKTLSAEIAADEQGKTLEITGLLHESLKVTEEEEAPSSDN